MQSTGTIKRQLVNVFRMHSVDLLPLVKKAALFSYDYNFRDGRSSYPLNITFDLTYRCNGNCSFCFLRDSINKDEDRAELSFREIKTVIEELSKHKPSIFLTGGEPLLRADLIDIIKLIKSHSLRCGLVTNGKLLTPETAKAISDAGLDYMLVSVNSAFSNIQNIKNLTSLQKKPKVFMNYPLSETNIEGIPMLAAKASEANVDGLFIQQLSYSTANDIRRHEAFSMRNNLELGFSSYKDEPFESELVVRLNDYLERLKKEAKERGLFLMFKPSELDKDQLLRWHSDVFFYINQCKYPWNVARISPSGDVYPCPHYHASFGNVKSMRFFDIWNNLKFREFRRLLKKGLLPGCNRCCKT